MKGNAPSAARQESGGTVSSLPHRDRREEIVNALTHGAGLLAAIAGTISLLQMASSSTNPLQVPSVLIYCVSLCLVYLSSTLYHAAHHPPTKSRLQVFDHCSIYLLIAGTYTPLLLLGLGNSTGWILFGIVWAMAAGGVVFKWFFTGRMARLSMATYMTMSFVALFAAKPLYLALPSATIMLVLAGGAAYVAGACVFASSRRYAHSVWHLFVMAGSTCHFFAITSVGLS
jgi:hemolysin III